MRRGGRDFDPRGGPDQDPYWWDKRPPLAPPLPPPEHGIRVGEVGSTWWGERWVRALARFGAAYTARLRRGFTYAQQGRVHDLDAVGGVVSASVTGSRPTPYRVMLSLKPLPDATWDRAIAAMAGKARFAAQLLAGEMPHEIDQAFAAARASLFPTRAGDLRTKCSCPDSANPCKHIAALHYVLGEAFDRDPFLLFELRGRSKDAVLQALRDLRASPRTRGRHGQRPGGGPPARRTAAPSPAADTGHQGRELKDVTPEAYDALRQPLGDLRFRITSPGVEGAIMRQLGEPPGWSLPLKLTDILQAAVAGAAAAAREMALGSQSEEPAASSESPQRARSNGTERRKPPG